MGGKGSGWHWRISTKDTTKNYRIIDVRLWHRQKLLTPNQTFETTWRRNGKINSSIGVHTKFNHIILSYRHQNSNKDWTDFNYPIFLDWTSCNYGNKRPWFLCPTQNCGRRVAILYSGKIFACRYCYQLTYQCQRETFPFRAIHQADKIRKKLNWEAGCFDSYGLKPKGMHRRTFKRLSIKHKTLVARADAWW